jgi:orotate phosphoribosyltransferase
MKDDMTAQQVARALLSIKAVGYTPDTPISFKSGIQSPVYVDNRRLPYWPEQWRVVIEGFAAVMRTELEAVDVIAGIETAGIPHSAALAYVLAKPSVFVRKQPKDHGTKSRIEGGDVSGKRIVLVEDLVTTGSSSLAGVEPLRDAGAIVNDCLTIITYGFEDTQERFARAGVRLWTLTTFEVVFALAASEGYFSSEAAAVVQDWRADPLGWAERYRQR